MLIYLLRHGIAQTRASSDRERELTQEGMLQTRSVAQQFEQHSPLLDKALVSPYKRARQTAASLQLVFPQQHFDVNNDITPDGSVHRVVDMIEKLDVEQLLLVSHNPFLSTLLSFLVDGTLDANRYMGNSMLVCISMEFVAPGCGEISYILEP